MALVPKLPDIAGSSAKDRTLFIFDAVNSMRAKRNEKHQLFPHCTEHVNQNIRYPGKKRRRQILPFVSTLSCHSCFFVQSKSHWRSLSSTSRASNGSSILTRTIRTGKLTFLTGHERACGSIRSAFPLSEMKPTRFS